MHFKSIFFSNLKFLLLSLIFILSLNSFAFSEENSNPFHPSSSPPSFANQKIKISDVVQFKVKEIDSKNSEIILHLTTEKDFKLYSDKLKFNLKPKDSLAYELQAKPSSEPQKILDPFYNEEKFVFENGVDFKFKIKTNIQPQDQILISLQACSHNVCMLPSTLMIDLNSQAISQEYSESKTIDYQDQAPSFSDFAKTQQLNHNSSENIQPKAELLPPKETQEKAEISPAINLNHINNSISYFLQNAFRNGSLILFPALFLAGLLMNLTPCVYPMIPITLSVMSQFEHKHANPKQQKRNQIIFPLIYVGAMVIVYSILGVVAGMTGGIFGSQFSSPIFSALMALLMFVFALAMLGFFNLAKVQSFAVKIPLAKNNPALAVATMGAVSGLVSAPCTGPVLSMILVLIAKTKDPISGFLYMMFFAIGFGLPYVFLGIISQKIKKMPKFPRMVELVKLLFAALMFSLGFYFLKPLIQKIDLLQFLYWKPNPYNVIVFILITFVFLFVASKKNLVARLCHLGSLVCLFFLCLWLTLYVTNSFIESSDSNAHTLEKLVKKSPIVWYTDYEKAVTLAQKTNKPMIVDVWADWCVACLEMEETTWKDPKIVHLLNDKFISVKLDFSNPSDATNQLVDDWKILGLPAIVTFDKNSIVQNKPINITQGVVSTESLLKTLQQTSEVK